MKPKWLTERNRERLTHKPWDQKHMHWSGQSMVKIHHLGVVFSMLLFCHAIETPERNFKHAVEMFSLLTWPWKDNWNKKLPRSGQHKGKPEGNFLTKWIKVERPLHYEHLCSLVCIRGFPVCKKWMGTSLHTFILSVLDCGCDHLLQTPAILASPQ